MLKSDRPPAYSTKTHALYVVVVNTWETANHAQSIVQTSLQEKEGESNDEWEIKDLQGIEVESNDSNDGDPYHQQLAGVNVEDVLVNSIKEAILGLLVPTSFKGEG